MRCAERVTSQQDSAVSNPATAGRIPILKPVTKGQHNNIKMGKNSTPRSRQSPDNTKHHSTVHTTQ
jgi:hypothetical protein